MEAAHDAADGDRSPPRRLQPLSLRRVRSLDLQLERDLELTPPPTPSPTSKRRVRPGPEGTHAQLEDTQVANLASRYPFHTEGEILGALRDSAGHAGAAAKLLRLHARLDRTRPATSAHSPVMLAPLSPMLGSPKTRSERKGFCASLLGKPASPLAENRGALPWWWLKSGWSEMERKDGSDSVRHRLAVAEEIQEQGAGTAADPKVVAHRYLSELQLKTQQSTQAQAEAEANRLLEAVQKGKQKLVAKQESKQSKHAAKAGGKRPTISQHWFRHTKGMNLSRGRELWARALDHNVRTEVRRLRAAEPEPEPENLYSQVLSFSKKGAGSKPQ